MLAYMTEAQIRERARLAFITRIEEENRRYKELEDSGGDVSQHRRKYPEAALNSPEYRKWIDDRIQDARDRGVLVTDQQLVDLRAHRRLQLGDRARYVGPPRLENTRSGRTYQRVTGELGTISKASRRSDDRYIYIFTPLPPPGSLAADGPYAFIAELTFSEGTPGYLTIERIPESTQDAALPPRAQDAGSDDDQSVGVHKSP